MTVTNPFPGLRPFAEDEEHLFFGREAQVDSMVDKLAATRFLAVVGTSGSGKSSLVNCGLRPALHRGNMASAGTSWRMAQFRPGNHPIAAMAAALAKPGVLYAAAPPGPFTLAEIVESSLRLSKLGLLDVFDQARLPEGVNLLVVADQFEELFRYNQVGAAAGDAPPEINDEAIAFVNLLLAARDEPSRIYVVLTMRSDFLGECAQFYGLPEAINHGQYLVPRMTRDERRRAIAGPVGVEEADIDPALLTRLVNDVGSNPDQLSILQHALNRTWARWEKDEARGPLALTHYEAIGTMAHALDQHAEKAYVELTTERERQICEKLFKALTDKATDARGVRRPTGVATLLNLTGATLEELTRVVDVFRKPSRSFLMPPAGEALAPETIVDISHESLMRVWERLRGWADDEARSAATYRRLSETAALYAEGRASLWRGADLDEGLAWRNRAQPVATWAERYAPGFDRAMSFLEESVAARDAERKHEIDQRIKKERDQKRNVMVTASLAVIIVILVASLALQRKEREKDAAEQQAVKNLFAETTQTTDAVKVEQSFDALEQISTLTATVAPQENSDVTVEYFLKPADSQKLPDALKALGFTVTFRDANNPMPTNCLWYGSNITDDEAKLVAYAIIRAGIDLRAIEPRRRGGPRSIQVGHSAAFQSFPPFTVDEIKSKPLPELRRALNATTPNS